MNDMQIPDVVFRAMARERDDAKATLKLALAQLEIARKALRSMGRSYHQIGADALRDMAAVKRGKRGAK